MQDAVRNLDTRVYAGLLRRASAYLVDSLLLIVPAMGISWALGAHDNWASLLTIVMWWIYKAGLESGPGQATLGKRALGIQVTDLEGNRISFARASGRYFGTFLSALILGVGFLMAGFTKRKQALHDMMASCLVVRAGATPEEIGQASGTMPVTFGAWVGAAVVVFIPAVGILAAIAIPAYQDYVVRARTMEAVAEAARWKASAHAAFEDYARNPVSEPVIEESPRSRYVSRVVIRKPERRIEVHLAAAQLHSSRISNDAQIHLTFRGAEGWACDARGIDLRYLPAACRH